MTFLTQPYLRFILREGGGQWGQISSHHLKMWPQAVVI